MRQPVALATAACLALGGVTAAGSTAAVGAPAPARSAESVQPASVQPASVRQPLVAAQPAASSITWGPCRDVSLKQADAECGFLSVPLDHSRPRSGTIKLALSRVRHTSPAAAYQGVMLVNPGGPGGSGLNLALLGADVPKHAGDTYDWIGFDPRGVGSSEPALSCIPSYFKGNRPAYVPVTDALLATWKSRAASYAKACGRNAAKLLPHLKTVDSARDMDAIRAALGAPKLSYYGFSYGTYLGQVYATLFPSRVRRMVLDSNVDPRDVWYRANLRQDSAFELVMGAWFSWLAKYSSDYQLGSTADEVRQRFFEEETALRGHPAQGVLGPDEWDDAFLLAGYVQATWPGLASAFASWVHHRDATQVIAAYEDFDTPGDDNGYAIYSAVQCTDAPWPKKWSTWAADSWRLNRSAPFLTWGNTWLNAPCLTWPAKPGTPVTVRGGNTSALLIDETLDAAAPYEGSIEVRRRFPRSSLIAEPGGTTHAGSLRGNACVDDKIAAYLANGVLPVRRAGVQADAECAPLPQPVPDSAGTATPSPSLLMRVAHPAGAIRH
jgi:pimeloyl-ACP methyl ester carboxylesterase